MGANPISNWQSAPAGREAAGQELAAISKGAVTAMEVMGIAAELLLAAWTGSEAEVEPTATWPKLIRDGVRLMAPAAVAVPSRSTANWPP